MSRIVTPFTRRAGLARAAASLGLLPFAAQPRLVTPPSAFSQPRADGTDEAGSESISASLDLCQKIIVPAYFEPGPAWDRAIAGSPGIIILNPNSGAGSYQERWNTLTQTAQRHRIKVIGYVRTNLAKRPLREVKKEIDRYVQWYGVDGIYLDVATGTKQSIPYYRNLADYVHTRSPEAIVALNPALALNERYLSFVDILCIYEWKYSEYRKKSLPAWIHQHAADRFIHVIYGVPNLSAAQATLNLTKRRNAGYVFITHVSDPAKVYKSLGNYWNLMVDNVC